MRESAVGQAGGSCYSQAALSSNDSKTLYRNTDRVSAIGCEILHHQMQQSQNFINIRQILLCVIFWWVRGETGAVRNGFMAGLSRISCPVSCVNSLNGMKKSKNCFRRTGFEQSPEYVTWGVSGPSEDLIPFFWPPLPKKSSCATGSVLGRL